MEDKFYVLCEFVNEAKKDADGSDWPCQVGYAEWLINRDHSVPISELIENETKVTLRWPKNRDVQPKECMLKKNEVIEWMDVVAVLKGQHDSWPEIIEASKNLVRYGIAFPTKEQRREFSKNSTRNSTESVSSKTKRKGLGEEKEQVVHKKPRLGNKSKKDSKGFSTKSIVAATKAKRTVKIDDSDTDDDLLGEISKASSTGTSCFDNYLNSFSKGELMAKVQYLEKRNLELEEMVTSYKNMISVVEEFPKLASKMKELVAQSERSSSRHESSKSRSESRRHESSKSQSGSSRHESSSCHSRSDRRETSKHSLNSSCYSSSALFSEPLLLSNRDNHTEKTSVHKPKEVNTQSPKISKDVTLTDLTNITGDAGDFPRGKSISSLTNPTSQSKKNADLPEKPVASFSKYWQEKLKPFSFTGRPGKAPLETDAQVQQQPEKPIDLNDISSDDEQADINAFEKEDMDFKDNVHHYDDDPQSPTIVRESSRKEEQIRKVEQVVFVIRSVDKERVTKLRHSKPTILAGELLSLVFSPEELALCTLKGKKSNKGNDGGDRSRLDVQTVDAIVEYICKTMRLSGEKVTSDINTAMTNKLNNFKKSPEGKEIIARHMDNSNKPAV